MRVCGISLYGPQPLLLTPNPALHSHQHTHTHTLPHPHRFTQPQISLDTRDVCIECTATDLTKAKIVLDTGMRRGVVCWGVGV